MRTGCIHFSASLLTERNGAGQALRLATWPGIGSEVGARTRLPIRSLLFDLSHGRECKPRSPSVRPSLDKRFALRGRRICFNDEVFHRAAADLFWQRSGRFNFLANFDCMKAE
jgi:hypothetical protein